VRSRAEAAAAAAASSLSAPRVQSLHDSRDGAHWATDAAYREAAHDLGDCGGDDRTSTVGSVGCIVVTPAVASAAAAAAASVARRFSGLGVRLRLRARVGEGVRDAPPPEPPSETVAAVIVAAAEGAAAAVVGARGLRAGERDGEMEECGEVGTERGEPLRWVRLRALRERRRCESGGDVEATVAVEAADVSAGRALARSGSSAPSAPTVGRYGSPASTCIPNALSASHDANSQGLPAVFMSTLIIGIHLNKDGRVSQRASRVQTR